MTPVDLPLRTLSQYLRAGTLSAEEVASEFLERIAKRESAIQAWIWFDREAVLRAARAADAATAKGPLHAIPVGVKDVIDTATMPTAYGSPIYSAYQPLADAAVVGAMRDAGALLFGKTVTCEFAGGEPSKTRNPHDPRHTPGGSSSGSAAAVAAGMVPIAFGTQTAGSIIRPASFCGVVGYKPSFGLINRAGLKPLSESVDTIGLFARRVDDAGWFLSHLTGRPELADDLVSGRPPLLRLCRTDQYSEADEDGRRVLEDTARRLASCGAVVTDEPLPISNAALVEDALTVIATDARRAFAHELGHAPQALSGRMKAFLAMADVSGQTRYDAAQRRLALARTALAGTFSAFDAILTLSAPGEAPRDLTTTGRAIFNIAWSALHGPCLSLPAGTGANDMPIGVQLVGPCGGDAALLGAARWVEAALAGS